MEPLALVSIGVIASIGATLRWLSKAPEGHEDANGFHAAPAPAPAEKYNPIHSDSTPPFVPHGL